jgi:PKD repeat protein
MGIVLEGAGDQPGIRSFLVSEQNLEMTGTRDEDLGAACAPKSLFHVNQSGGFFQRQTMICEGDNVAFRANAFNGEVSTHTWNFQGGSPATSSTTNPTVSYDSPGRYDVALTVSNDIGSDTRTFEEMVIVSSNTAQYQSDWGYYDTFWEEEGFLNDYIVFNHDETEHTWEFYSGQLGGSTGNESVRMRNFGNVVGRVDELISPSHNLSTVSNPTLKFKWSGAARNNSPNDRLRIYFSTNCGKTWTLRSTISGFDLVNSGVVSTSYVPNAASIWSEAQVTLPPTAANAPNVRVKFQWTSGGNGNNFYIDDITLSNAPLSAESLEREIDLNIFPNPTSQSTTVSMMLADPARVEMTMIDMMGRKVMDVHAGQLTSGPHRLDIDMSSLPVGIYFLRMAVENNIAVKKVVKN